jgi:D-serine deaminase-like pyridoxal phosphate-dependent protein
MNSWKDYVFLRPLYQQTTILRYNENDILESSKNEIQRLNDLKNLFSECNPLISIGDTPTCSLMTNFNDIDEIRPGNFVYYDLIMLNKGVCTLDEISSKVFCPIVDINPERDELVIHGGAIHFSKEFVEIENKKVFGKAIRHIGKEISESDEYVVSLSQEHGIIKITNTDIKQYNIGDLLEIIPVHSCLTANLMKNRTLHY